jgi:hypothetical protein
MNAQIDQELKGHCERFRRDHDRLRDELMESLPSLATPAAPRSRSRRWAAPSLVGMAVGIAVAAVVYFSVFSNSTSLYAKAVTALQKAQTVHIVGRERQGDQWVKVMEVWYGKDRGVRELRQSGDQTAIRIDDGTFQWHHVLGQTSAIRSRSVDPVGSVVAKVLLPSKDVMRQFKPDPTGDRAIDGVPCRMLAYTNDAKTRRTHLWIDGRNRLLRSEKYRLIEGQWCQTVLAEAQYDVAIRTATFLPDFGDQVKIIEAEHLFEERFSVETAIHSQEVLGMVVAVHELNRVEDDMFFVTFSTRASEDTLRRFGPLSSIEDGRHKHGSNAYGDFTFRLPGKRVSEKEWQVYQTMELATYYKDGTRVHWALVIQKGTWPEHVEEFEFGGIVHTRMALREEREKRDLPTYKQFYPMIVLPLPEHSTPLEEIMEQVYHETCLLEPFAFQLSLHLQSQPFTEQEVQQHIRQGHSEHEARLLSSVPIVSPRRISLEQWKADVYGNIESLR